MPIDLPNLRTTESSRLIACGAIQTTREELLDWLSQRRVMIATYSRAGVRHFARLMTGGQKKRHFHFEVVLFDWFPAKMKPKTNSKISDLQRVAEHVFGEKIDLNLGSEFRVQVTELSETGPIRLLSTQTRVGGTTIQLTGGTLSVSGSRIREISWERLTDKEVMVNLKTQLDSVVAPKYLLDGQDLVGRLFKVLVLGRTASETSVT